MADATRRRGLRTLTLVALLGGTTGASLALADVEHDQFKASRESDGPPYYYKEIAGMIPFRVSKDELLITQGGAVDNSGKSVIEFLRSVKVDIRKVGFLGRDDVATQVDVKEFGDALVKDPTKPNGYRAVYAQGHEFAGQPIEGWYNVVYLRNSSTGETGAMLSRQITSMGSNRPNDARAPDGFDQRRHAPIGYYYSPATGFRSQLCYGWPLPFCVYTLAGTQPAFAVVENFSNEAWQRISLVKWLPDSARVMRLQAVVTGVSGTGSAWVSSSGRGTGAVKVGHVNLVGDTDTMIFEIATDSAERLAVRTDPGVQVSLYAAGYAIAQPY